MLPVLAPAHDGIGLVGSLRATFEEEFPIAVTFSLDSLRFGRVRIP